MITFIMISDNLLVTMVAHHGKSICKWTVSIKDWSHPDGHMWARPKLWKVGSTPAWVANWAAKSSGKISSGALVPSGTVRNVAVELKFRIKTGEWTRNFATGCRHFWMSINWPHRSCCIWDNILANDSKYRLLVHFIKFVYYLVCVFVHSVLLLSSKYF